MAQVRKFQSGGSQPELKPAYKRIIVEGLGEVDPEAIRTKFAQDPDAWYNLTGADPKYRDLVITRMGEILDTSKQYQLKVDNTDTYTFDNPQNNGIGVNDKYKSTGKFNRKGIFGIGGRKMDDNAINNLAYYTIGKLIRGDLSIPGSQSNTSRYDDYLSAGEQRMAELQQDSQNKSTATRKAYNSINWKDLVGTGIYGGNQQNLENFRRAYSSDEDRFNKLRGLFLKELTDLTDPEWDTKYRWTGNGTRENYTANLLRLIDSMSSNTWNNDIYRAAFDLGAADWIQPFLDNNFREEGQLGQQGQTANQWMEGYGNTPDWVDQNEYRAIKYRLGRPAGVIRDPETEEIVYTDENGTPLNDYSQFDYRFSPFEKYQDSFLYQGRITKPDDPSLPWEAQQELANARTVSDENAIYGNENYEYRSGYDSPTLRGLVTRGGYYADVTSMFPDVQKGHSLIGVYDENNRAGLPNNYIYYDGTQAFPGMLTYENGKIKIADNSGSSNRSYELGTRYNRQGQPSNLTSNPQFAYQTYDPKNTSSEMLTVGASNIFNGTYDPVRDKEIFKDIYNKFIEKGSWALDKKNQNGSNKQHVVIYANENSPTGYKYFRNQKGEYLLRRENTDDFVWVKANQVALDKLGGVIHMQDGGAFALEMIDSNFGLGSQNTLKQSNKKSRDPSPMGQNLGDTRTSDFGNVTFTAGEKAELGLLATDLVASIAGFIPGANLAATAVGAGSSLGQFGINVDRTGWGDLSNWGNLAVNLGLDALSLIPGGKAVKAGKIIKNLPKWVPKLLSVSAVTQVPEMAASISKITSNEELTVDDYRNIANAIRLAIGGANQAATSTKNRFSTSVVHDGKTYNVDLGAKSKLSRSNLTNDKIIATAKRQNPELKDITEGITVPTIDSKYAGRFWKATSLNSNDFTVRTGDGKALNVFKNDNVQFRFKKTPFSESRRSYMGNETLSGKKIVSPEYKEGGKIIKAQDGTRTRQIRRYPGFGVQYNDNYADYDHQAGLNVDNNKLYGGVQGDLTNRIGFYQLNLPSWVVGNLVNDGNVNTQGNTVLDFLNRYNQYNDATRDYFLKRGWGNADAVNSYAQEQQFLSPQQGNTARSTDNKLGNYTSTRAAWMNKMVSPQLLKQLNDAGIYTAQNALANSDAAKRILGDQLYNDVTLDLTPGQGADYVIGVKEDLTPIRPNVPPATLIPNRITPLNLPPGITTPANPQDPQDPANTTEGKAGNYGNGNNKQGGQQSNWDPVPLMRGLEVSLGIIGNNSLRAPRLTPKDPLDLYTFVSGDLQQRSMLQNQGNNLRRWAQRPSTSDASLQSARELEAESKAADLTRQGWLADSNMIRETGYRSVERQHENARNRNQISNLNRDIFDLNQNARTALQNLKNLANYGILLNVVRDTKNEMITNREFVRNAEITHGQEQNYLNFTADQSRLRNEYNDRYGKIEKARTYNQTFNLDLSKLDPTKDADQIKILQDRISTGDNIIKENQDWISGTGNNSYYSNLLKANRNLGNANLNTIRTVASDNRWAPRFAPNGYFGFRKKGGRIPMAEKAALQNQKDANISSRTLSRNLNKKAISENQENQKMVREIAKTYHEILKKFANKPTPRLK